MLEGEKEEQGGLLYWQYDCGRKCRRSEHAWTCQSWDSDAVQTYELLPLKLSPLESAAASELVSTNHQPYMLRSPLLCPTFRRTSRRDFQTIRRQKPYLLFDPQRFWRTWVIVVAPHIHLQVYLHFCLLCLDPHLFQYTKGCQLLALSLQARDLLIEWCYLLKEAKTDKNQLPHRAQPLERLCNHFPVGVLQERKFS